MKQTVDMIAPVGLPRLLSMHHNCTSKIGESHGNPRDEYYDLWRIVRNYYQYRKVGYWNGTQSLLAAGWRGEAEWFRVSTIHSSDFSPSRSSRDWAVTIRFITV